MSTIRSLCSVLSFLQGWTIVPDALKRPSVFLRESLPEDAPFLLSASKSSGFRAVHCPAKLAGWDRKIGISQRSFGGGAANPAAQEYLFTVLSDHSDKAIPVAGSVLAACEGSQAEAGAVFVHAAVRAPESVGHSVTVVAGRARHTVTVTGCYGEAASWVRWLWMAMPELRSSFRSLGQISENALFLGARDLLFGGSNGRPDEIGWTYGLMGVYRPERGVRFRAALGPFFVVEDDLFTTALVAKGLMLRLGDRITASVAPL